LISKGEKNYTKYNTHRPMQDYSSQKRYLQFRQGNWSLVFVSITPYSGQISAIACSMDKL